MKHPYATMPFLNSIFSKNMLSLPFPDLPTSVIVSGPPFGLYFYYLAVPTISEYMIAGNIHLYDDVVCLRAFGLIET